MILKGLLYRRVRNSGLGWQVVNLPSRLNFLRQRGPLLAAEALAVRSLRERGIAVAHITDLLPAVVFGELRRLAEERWARYAAGETFARRAAAAAVKSKNLYLVDLWGGPHIFDAEHPYLRFSLSAPILRIVSHYLGMLPKFREFFLQVTIPLPAGEAPYASQRWHADPDDRKLVKTFLYLSDVDASAGPFTYIEGTHGGGKWRSRFPFNPALGRHPDAGLIERAVPPSDIRVATGRAGTLIFCDTSGIHRGGYATTAPRIMYTSVYTTRASARATRLTYPPDFRPGAIASPIVRYAVTPNRS